MILWFEDFNDFSIRYFDRRDPSAYIYTTYTSVIPQVIPRAAAISFITWQYCERFLRAIMRLKIHARCHRHGSYTRPKSQILARNRTDGKTHILRSNIAPLIVHTSFSTALFHLLDIWRRHVRETAYKTFRKRRRVTSRTRNRPFFTPHFFTVALECRDIRRIHSDSAIPKL